ncbi:flavin-binding monooxygenase-like family protein [Mycena pura]|uniref:Flavin-binding monooxygenase-like family protein n=1 Tax=Mycena pura TaxID=153505 RepID=A0AAD6Y711_9AGAR|nr:flavin-binding monooxygenase-like family protein [Mycena pura]
MSKEPAVTTPDPALQEKYIEERDKRLRADGSAQFIRLVDSDRFKHLEDDPWVDHTALNAQAPALQDGDNIRFLVLGAGFGGLLFAVRLIEAGFAAADIRLVDDAGGFGGTWYWNRFPGIMCDTESYIYMPLLEETGYMPQHKYSHGAELREHAERIAAQWGLADKALFRTRYTRAAWDDTARRWTVHLLETRGRGRGAATRAHTVRAQFVFAASGILVAPHIPRLPGLEDFSGACFHTARWDYAITGGTPTDWNLRALAGKRVGIIGTGATAVQAVPHLARHAQRLYVFQRTPSSVDVRGQRRTDPEEWRTGIAPHKGWQRARCENFNARLAHGPNRPEADLVADGWCHQPGYAAALGREATDAGTSPIGGDPDAIARHVAALHAADVERAERVRARADAIVVDPRVAQLLKAWYPVWCKRPTFHDDYLPAFNLANVELVDTDGRGLERGTSAGVMANGVEYALDVLIFSTGYVAPGAGTGSPAGRGCAEVRGRGGRSMDDKWVEDGAATLHGVTTNGFPNFFFHGPSQGGASVIFTYMMDTTATRVAGMLKAAMARVGGGTAQMDRLVVEVTRDAEEAWSMEILKRASWFAAMSGCTPGYINNEGENDRTDPQARMKAARRAPWGEGIGSFVKVMNAWHDDGQLEGLEISVN